MEKQMKDTKIGLVQFLKERMDWFINYGNPFQESTMVKYILDGLNELNALDVSDKTPVIMYDEDGVLKFKVEA